MSSIISLQHTKQPLFYINSLEFILYIEEFNYSLELRDLYVIAAMNRTFREFMHHKFPSLLLNVYIGKKFYIFDELRGYYFGRAMLNFSINTQEFLRSTVFLNILRPNAFITTALLKDEIDVDTENGIYIINVLSEHEFIREFIRVVVIYDDKKMIITDNNISIVPALRLIKSRENNKV